ncbi:NUDIX hydrolase domain-like protein [Gilbertella persicaria]|uniref:NUDIX hydrolase domain-like protein n=1 Tax=Gilbertella persicaria TaxID=101096 RepID=UPI00221F6D21|nr:NUDIX hydrolase domain-like protein [Gilbertella persicaria]KAI8063664.1 NUDIX hydrolase domain-like protein [Gilbertella persicaria]
MPEQKEVRVGVGCFVTYISSKDSKRRILIGKRAGSHGAGTWQLPGGHLEMFEDFETCAQREILEETNLHLDRSSISMVTATNNIMLPEKKHYVTIFMWSNIDESSLDQVKVMEPHKLEGEWEWVTLNELRQRKPLFSPLEKLLTEHQIPFD